MDTETHNYRQIEMLNQRGGRTLSIVDLITARTISVEMAAYALRAMERGYSLLTGARPGGAGKTTLMASILHFLPPDERIVTVDHPDILAEGQERSVTDPACYLVHEIGSGHYYGYLWGRDVADLIAIAEGPHRIASCLHADTLEEMTNILCLPPLRVDYDSLGCVGLILFIHAGRGPDGYRHRVTTFHEADGRGGHRLLFEWNPAADTFRQVGELCNPDELEPYVNFVRELVADGESDCREVRAKVVEFYRRSP